jgi:hypothetical protein
MFVKTLLVLAAALATAHGILVDSSVLDGCPGYNATNVNVYGPRLTADLHIAGRKCNVFGEEIDWLRLEVVYETREPFFNLFFSLSLTQRV